MQTEKAAEKTMKKGKILGYPKLKIGRSFLHKIMGYPCRYYKANYMADALALLSEAVGINFFEGDYDCPFDSANCYINLNRLMVIWDEFVPAKCIERLDLLKKWGVLNWQFGANVTRHHQIRIYIKFKMFTQYLCNNIKTRQSKGYDEQRFNINNHYGFFWVDPAQFVEFFFKKHKYQHGIKDLIMLLYFNTSYDDPLCPYDELRLHPIVTFGQMCGESKEKKDPDNLVMVPNYYVRQKDLASFMHIPISALRNMLNRLEREGVIYTKYICNKGTSIIFRTQENENKEEVFENIKKAVYSLKETRKKAPRGMESFCGLGVKVKLFYVYLQQVVNIIQEQRDKHSHRRNHINRHEQLASCLADVPVWVEIKDKRSGLSFEKQNASSSCAFSRMKTAVNHSGIFTDANDTNFDEDFSSIDGVHDDLPF